MMTMLVNNLSYRHMVKLISFLDQRRSWYDLGRLIFHEDTTSKCALATFQNGGDSPATRFMESLVKRVPDTTLNEFRNIAIKLKRRDISNYIESFGQDHILKQLRDLSPEQMHRITLFLDVNYANDWRMFADTFNYSYQEIEILRQRDRVVQKPSECLFALLKGKHPLLTIEELKDYLKRIARNDIVEYLNSI